jgi:hypothetical protein
MAVDIKFLIDGTDRGQPTNAEEFGVTVNDNTDINARIVSFDNDLIFVGGVYEYLFNKLDSQGFCNLIEVDVQYQCAGLWKRLTNGYIVLSECNFILDRCQVKTKIYDNSFSTKINNNKGIPFSMSGALTKNLQPVVPPTPLTGLFFNPTNGSYGAGVITGVSVYDAFKHLVACMSDNLIDFASDYYYFDTATSVISFNLLTNGEAINRNNATETVVSFETLYIALKNKINLGMAFETQANGRPLLRIEPAAYFFESNPLVNLYDQPNIDLTFDKARLYQAVNFGSSPMLEKEACDDGNMPCTFIQTPFRGFRDETFGFTGECNTSNILKLKTDEVVFDTNVIENTYRFSNETHKLNPFIVDCRWFASGQEYRANYFDPYNIGQTVYNGNFRNALVSSNFLEGYPNSLFSFLENPFDPVTTESEAQMSDSSQVYLVGPASANFNTFYRYSVIEGNWLEFFTETDPYNLFDGESYACPYVGIYTVDTQLIFDNFDLSAPQVVGRGFSIIITHLNSDAQVIEEFTQSATFDTGSADAVTSYVRSFICNVGDLIRIDARTSYQAGTGPFPPAQRFLDTANIDGIDYTSYFNVSGVPLLPEELEAVNIDDVRAYLYKFDRPLRMEEIENILDNTSKPIKFGRWDDPLRVIEGYIKTVNVKSIVKQDASIELKSNKILR